MGNQRQEFAKFWLVRQLRLADSYHGRKQVKLLRRCRWELAVAGENLVSATFE